MSAKPKFAHVVLQSPRFDAIREWHCSVLVAHVVYQGHWAERTNPGLPDPMVALTS
jgi:hypothetical protein